MDASGSAYVTGVTGSSDFPLANAVQATSRVPDAFVAKLGPGGSALVYSTYLGGGGFEWGYAIAVDGTGGAYVTGDSGSLDFPVANAFQPTNRGGWDGFVTQLSPGGSALVYSTYLGGSDGDWLSGSRLTGTAAPM